MLYGVPRFTLKCLRSSLRSCSARSAPADLCRDRQVIHWIDNTSAISCLIHGYSGKADSALLVNAFNLFNAGLKSRIHYEYVESKANVADLPSRQEFEFLRLSLCSRAVPMHIPDASSWSGPLRHFLSLASCPGDGSSRTRTSKKRSRVPGHARKKRAALRAGDGARYAV